MSPGAPSRDAVTVVRMDPRLPEARALVADLDAFLTGLYEMGDNYLTPVEELAEAGAVFLVARDGDRAIGCGAIRPFAYYAEVKRMYVRPEERGRRVGLALLRALEAETRALGLPFMRLETGPRQLAAVALYEREGFVRRGPFGDYPGCGGSLFMEKAL